MEMKAGASASAFYTSIMGPISSIKMSLLWYVG
ncbi:hypothetical protein BpOF4_08195 [Alkalihalophilus pseudofirmus OF4]|uniref:Uncharacterized protein n=1 Tax=Alkalihalophilus pseudofirmus (strain ATCC BAA-2126 / JCM 17055 / OF4) TaxID=398511 RepID=D3FR01_ALKPO|nr:hypothetical protein BpOF4_08195 [Alkalihalophilus pseudofirmus OF4]